MEQNPDELEVTPVVEVTESAPKASATREPGATTAKQVATKPRTRVPKKAREQIERAKRESEAQAMSNCPASGVAKKEIENEESARDTVVIEEPKPITKVPGHQVLKCECGCDIMPDTKGMYPARCPECGTWNDYRGVKFLEQSESILVCDKCGGLTLLTPETVCCEHCGAR